MVIKSVKKVDVNELFISKDTATVNYLICACGFETRCTFIARQFSVLFEKKFVFSFDTHTKSKVRQHSIEFFRENNFNITQESESASLKIQSLIKDLLSSSRSSITFYVDYSSMPRIWYAGIIECLKNFQSCNDVTVIFLYSEAKFLKPIFLDSYNLYVEPIKGFTYFGTPDRPTALILGLGYESRRPLGLKEYFDANKVILFITDKSSNGYHNEVLKKNKELIDSVKINNPNDVFYYPTFDQEYTFFELERLCQSLISHYRVIIAPCGPKFFALCSLLVSVKNEEIDVWRISVGETREPFDRLASGNIWSLQINYRANHF